MVNTADTPLLTVPEPGEIDRFDGPVPETAPLPPPSETVTLPEPPFLCIDIDDGETAGTQGVGVGVAPGVWSGGVGYTLGLGNGLGVAVGRGVGLGSCDGAGLGVGVGSVVPGGVGIGSPVPPGEGVAVGSGVGMGLAFGSTTSATTSPETFEFTLTLGTAAS